MGGSEGALAAACRARVDQGLGVRRRGRVRPADGELRAKAAFVHCHEWWRTVEANGVKGPALVDARQALKRAAAA